MNWGIFKDENDTDTKYMYGAEKEKDIQTWILRKPNKAILFKSLIGGLVLFYFW